MPTFKTSPQIILTRPDPSAQEVPRETTISATFDMPIDPATINGDHFLVSGQGGGRGGTISYDARSKTAKFTPDMPFEEGETIYVELVNGISSLWSLSMEAGYSWTFEIEEITDVATDDVTETPQQFALHQNYPNPFNADTQIDFHVAETGRVRLMVYNMLGQVVRTLIDEDLPAGPHRAIWDGTNKKDHPLASGIYFCRLEAEGHRAMKKMVLTR
ncbi:Ig-like domain-containing protein [Candidatus Zixiibacteriota bacterium]